MILPTTAVCLSISFLISFPVAGLTQGAPSQSATVRIVLRSEAAVPGLQILLSDVARIQTQDRKLADWLNSQSIGRSPRGAFARWITRAQVLRLLKEKGLDEKSVRIEGERVQVTTTRARISSEELIRAAEVVLRAILQDQGEADVEWDLSHRPASIIAPLGRQLREVVATIPQGRIGVTNAFVRVQVKVDGEVVATAPLSFRLKRFRDVLIARTAIKRGQPFASDVLARKRINIAGTLNQPLTDVRQARGKVASRAIRPGTVLTELDTMVPPVIHKGDRVTIVAIVGNVRVSTTGIAMKDAAKGDIIPVVVVGKPKAPIFGKAYGTGIVVVGRQSASVRLPATPKKPRR